MPSRRLETFYRIDLVSLIIDSCFSFAIAGRPVGQGRYVLKTEGLGELLVFMRHKLWTIVCKTAKRNAMACEVGFSEIDDRG